MKRQVIMSLMVLLNIAAAQPPQHSSKPEPTKELLALGQRLYQDKCAICHGEKGDGRGEAAYLLYPRPRDFTQPIFKIRSTPSGSLPTDEDLFRTISEGMAGTAMPPWKDELSENERWALVYFLKTFSNWWKESPPAQPITLSPPPPETPELVALGKEIYRRQGCVRCHGESGKGDGPAAQGLTDRWGMPIRPYDFTVPGRFKGGGTPQDIVRTFLTGMDGTPMPSFQGNVSEKEAWALAYYVLSLGSGRPTPRASGHVLIAARHEGELPLDPLDPAWQKAKPIEVAVRSLWMREGGIERLQARALYNDKQIAILVEWEDPLTHNAFLRSQEFRDAVAVQFPLVDPEAKKPFFGMGAHDMPVNIWHWKADWQVEIARQRDIETAYPNMVVDLYPFRKEGAGLPVKTKMDDTLFLTGRAVGNPLSWTKRMSPVEDMNATGLSTLTSQSSDAQNVEGRGIWESGMWHVVFRRALRTPDPEDVQLRVGGRFPIAFAVWDGGAGDRDGQKAVTPWLVLEIGSPRPRPLLTARQGIMLLLGGVAVACFGFVFFSSWRRRRA